MTRKTIAMLLSFLLVFTILLTGCGTTDKGKDSKDPQDKDSVEKTDADEEVKTDEPPADEGKDETPKRDTLRVGIYAEPRTLDCPEANDEAARTAVYQIYDYLIREQPDNTLGPGLAESWEYSDDNMELIFHLREGVTFHNGDPMTAEDVVFSLNRAIESSFTSRVTSAMDSARIVDENTVVLRLKHPFGPAEQCVASAQMGILNKRVYEEDPEAYKRNPVGTGPYKFVDWNSGEDWTYEAFEDYYKGAPAIKRIEFKVLPDANTRVVALENNEVDFIFTAPPEEQDTIERHDDLVFYAFQTPMNSDLKFNNEDEHFSNKLVRQAVAHAVDRNAIILGALDGYGKPLHTPMTSAAFGWPEDFENREYNVEKAKQLLAEAGYPDGFTTTISTTDSLELYRKTAEIFQAQLQAIGIQAEIEVFEWGAFLDKVLTRKEYSVCPMQMTIPYLDADHIFELSHSRMRTEGRNYILANNAELDELLEKGRNSTDPNEREQIYRDICELWKEECFTIPLNHAILGVAAHKDLKGIVPVTTIPEYNYSYYYWGE